MALVDVYIQTLLCNVVFPAAVITFLTYHYRDALHDCWKGFLAAYLDHLQRKLYSRHSDRAKRRLFAAVHDLANEAALGDTVTVVEMECSGGANFGYYPDGIRLLCTSSNEAAGSYIRKAAHKHPNLCVEFLKDEKNKTKMLPNSSADVVVTMFALSAVEGVKASLREALRILKPVSAHYTLIIVTAELTHCMRLSMHPGVCIPVCIGNLTIVSSDNDLSSGRSQGIIFTNAGVLLID